VVVATNPDAALLENAARLGVIVVRDAGDAPSGLAVEIRRLLGTPPERASNPPPRR
jgi:hypothetical protein